MIHIVSFDIDEWYVRNAWRYFSMFSVAHVTWDDDLQRLGVLTGWQFHNIDTYD